MERMVPVPGGEVWASLTGEGPCVALLHGGMLASDTWEREAELLRSLGYAPLLVDFRAHGRSSAATTPYTHFDDLGAVFDAFDLGRATLVGLSLGGRVAIDFALQFPERVTALGLVAAGVSGMEFVDPYVLRLMQEQMAAVERRDAAAMVEVFLKAWVDGPARSPADVDAGLREDCRAMAAAMLPKLAASAPASELSAIERLGELTCPLLVVTGDLDSSDAHKVADRIEREAPNVTRVRIAGAGHMVNREQPEAFDVALLPFLAAFGRLG